MKVYRLELKNVNYPLSEIYLYFKDNYQNTINLFYIDGWYRAYGNSALVLSSIFNYKLFSSFIDTRTSGFPQSLSKDVFEKLKKLRINFHIISLSSHMYEYYDFESDNNYLKYSKIGNNPNILRINNRTVKEKRNSYNIKQQRINDLIELNRQKKEAEREKNDSRRIRVGDTVTIRNTETNDIEVYTIVPTLHVDVPKEIVSRRRFNNGGIIYKKELVSSSDLDKGKILSESLLAKKLIGSNLHDKIVLLDSNLKETVYQIIAIKKH